MSYPETYTIVREHWIPRSRAFVELEVDVEVTSICAVVTRAHVLAVCTDDPPPADAQPVGYCEGDVLDEDQALGLLGLGGEFAVCREARALWARDVTERAAL